MKMSMFQKILLGMAAFFLVAVLLLFGIKGNAAFSLNSIIGYDVFHTFQYYLFKNPTKSLTDFFSSYAQYEQNTNELRLLRRQVEGIGMLQAQMEQLQREKAELELLLAMKDTLSEYTSHTANIIARNESGWHSYLTVDLGSEDGVQLNQAVINHQGLVGKVYQVNKNTSIIKLVTAEDGLSKVSVKIMENGQEIECMLERYDANLLKFEVRSLDTNKEISEGATVVTSGLGGVFPSGILVGIVHEVKTMDNTIGKLVYVTPAVSFDNMDFLYVIDRLAAEVSS